MADAILDTFRKMIAEAHAASRSLGTQASVVRRLHELHPEAKMSTLNSYVSYGRSGTIADSFKLVERGRELWTAEATDSSAGRVRVKTIREAAPSDDVRQLVERVESLEAKLAEAEERIRTRTTAVEIKVRDEAGAVLKTRKVKGTLPAVFTKILKLATVRQNVLMVGPSGSGKTFLAEKVAEALELPFAFVPCSSGMSEGQIAGRLLPVEANGCFAYVPAPFVTCFEEGGVFLFDELDSADANTMTFLNSALANGAMSLPHRPQSPVARRHANFVCLAAANTFGHGATRTYAGRNQLDSATLDRFRAGVVQVDYDAAVEEALVDPEVLAWGRRIRKVIVDGRLRRIMSTRVLRDFTVQKRELGFGVADWEEAYFADWTEDDRAKVRAAQ